MLLLFSEAHVPIFAQRNLLGMYCGILWYVLWYAFKRHAHQSESRGLNCDKYSVTYSRQIGYVLIYIEQVLGYWIAK